KPHGIGSGKEAAHYLSGRSLSSGRGQFLQDISANQRLGIRRRMRGAGFAQSVDGAGHKARGIPGRRSAASKSKLAAKAALGAPFANNFRMLFEVTPPAIPCP